MPLLPFGEERFDPHLALAHCLGVGLVLVVRADPVKEGLSEVAVHNASVGAGRTLRFYRTGIAGGGSRTILHLLGARFASIRTQRLALRAHIDIARGIIAEAPGALVGGLVLPIRQRHIGVNALSFKS
jgi:hypothetical protein